MRSSAKLCSRKAHRAAFAAISSCCLQLLAFSVHAGGEMARRQEQSSSRSATQELQDHYASRQAALAATYERTAELTNWTASRWARRTTIVIPQKDRFGDPMYVRYGRRAYAGTPAYTGPAYVASFGSPADVPYQVLEGRARQYWGGAYSDPGYVPRTDVGLGVTTGQGYIQHGMQLTPGSTAPSYTRPAMLNSVLD